MIVSGSTGTRCAVRGGRVQQFQRVDDRVPGDHDRVAGDAFGRERRGGTGGRGQVQRGNPRDHPTVGLLGEGSFQIAAAQPGFDIDDRHVREEPGECTGERGGRVTLDDHHVGSAASHLGGERVDEDAVQRRQITVVGPRVAAPVGDDPERREHLVDDGTVLTGGDHDRSPARIGTQCADDRREFDRLGSRADDDHRPRRTVMTVHRGAPGAPTRAVAVAPATVTSSVTTPGPGGPGPAGSSDSRVVLVHPPCPSTIRPTARHTAAYQK